MLKATDIEQLRDGTWELDCPRMVLRKQSKDKTIVYEGGGYIKRSKNGLLQLKLYSPDSSVSYPELFSPVGTPGKLIEDCEFYELEAIDHTGRKWISDRIFPNTNGCVNAKGLVAYAKLGQLKYTSETNNNSAYNNNELKLLFFENFEIPGNTGTETSRSVGGQIREQRTTRNVAQFSSCGFDFEIRNENEGVTLEVESNDTLLPNLEFRVIEALQFVMGIPLQWVVMQKTSNNIKTICINRVSNNRYPPKIGAPINPKDLRNTSFVWDLFDKYLKYIIQFEEKNKYHPISVFVIQVLEGSKASIDPMMLTLGIAVEGILNQAFPSLKNLSDKEFNELNDAKQIINDSTLSEAYKKRLGGMLGTWNSRNAKGMMNSLVDSGIIKREEVRAWNEIRHPMAHAILPDTSDYQKMIDLCNIVTVLFYKLIFHAIGYQGEYTNYGSYGYPTEKFPTE